MPEKGIDLIPHKDILSFEEFERLIKILADFGITKVRITGGEPLVRLGVFPFLKRIKSQTKVKSLFITTNGVRTARYLDKLAEIGLDGINLSFDTLDKKRFQKISRRDEFDSVWESLMKAIKLKMKVKINTVIQNGFNTDEIIPLANLAKKYPIDIRFIEEMPFNGHGMFSDETFSIDKIQSTLMNTYPNISEITENETTAKLFKVHGFAGNIGIIGAYSRSFCGNCNRLRITPTGMLKTCLYDDGVLDLHKKLRDNCSDDEIILEIRKCVSKRDKDGFSSELKKNDSFKSMATIGG